MWDYTEKVREFFLNPKNIGEVENPDGVGDVGSIVCGDALRLTLKIDKETNRITDAKFQTFGCASAIASSSALTELIKGKTIEEALKITNQDIADFLGGLPKEKMHCSVMGREALEAAVANYKGIPVTIEEEGKLVCKCFNVTEEKIRKVAIENHLTTVDEITDFTKAGGGCGECKPEIEADTEGHMVAENSGKAVNAQKAYKPPEDCPDTGDYRKGNQARTSGGRRRY